MTQRRDTLPENIIPLHKFRPGQTVNPLRLVEGYWSALREGNDLPKRSQVHPRGLSDVLEYVFILERVAPGVARFRIAGSQWTALAGMEVRGMPISSFFRTTGRADMAAALEACFDTPAVIEAHLTARSLQRAPDVPGKLIMLPMRCDLGRISRILGAAKMSGPMVSDAYRLEMSDVSVKPVFGDRPAPPPSAHTAAPTSTPRRPHLELVHSSDRLS